MLGLIPLTIVALVMIYVVPIMGGIPGLVLEDELLMAVGIGFVLVFAMPGVVVHWLSPIDVVKRAGMHFLEEPAWHLGFIALKFFISIALSYIPLVGSAILCSVNIRYELLAYIAVCGSGSES